MNALKIVVKILLGFLALRLIVGSVSEDFGAQLSGPKRFGLCLFTFGSVVLLHFLIWHFVVGKSTLLGRDPKSFIELGGSKTFFSGLTIFGYISLALHFLRVAGFPDRIDPSVSGNSDRLIYGLAFGLTLIGIGLAARLRMLFQNAQTILR